MVPLVKQLLEVAVGDTGEDGGLERANLASRRGSIRKGTPDISKDLQFQLTRQFSDARSQIGAHEPGRVSKVAEV